MKILIIEPNGAKYMVGDVSRFEVLIKQEMFKHKNLMDTETEFLSRDLLDLEDMLYEQSSCHLRKEAALYFDTIDLVFINGDPKLPCWGKRCEFLSVFLRMCIKTKKLVFATGLAFCCLIMLCATDLEKGCFNVVNGNGHGSKLQEINKEIRLNKFIDENDVFLDTETGDFYRYNYETKEWVPKGNMGMHKKIYTQESGENQVVSTTTYKAKVHDADVLYVTHKDESVIYLRKNFIHHWSVEGCPNKFLAMNDSPFEVHPFNFRNPTKVFEIVAETRVAPMIISINGGCILATQFMINKNYPGSLKPMENFIKDKLTLIRAGRSPSLSISVVDSTWYTSEHMERDIQNARETPFRHCGMTSSVKGYQFVDNNSIRQRSFPAFVLDRSRTSAKSRQKLSNNTFSGKNDFNRLYKKSVATKDSFKKVPRRPEPMNQLNKSENVLLKQQMPEFRFKYAGQTKNKFYGNYKLLKSEGFEFDDGWVPGYRSIARVADPLEDNGEPVLHNSNNQYIKDLMDKKIQDRLKAAGIDQSGKQASNTHNSEKSRPIKEVENSDIHTQITKTSFNKIPSLLDIYEPSRQSKPSQTRDNYAEQISRMIVDANMPVKRNVVVRKIAPKYYTNYKSFKKINNDIEAGKYYYSVPYVEHKQCFR